MNIEAAARERPLDIHGNPLVSGPWYWAQNQIGQIVGTGKYLFTIGGGAGAFFINGTGYDCVGWKLWKADAAKPESEEYCHCGEPISDHHEGSSCTTPRSTGK